MKNCIASVLFAGHILFAGPSVRGAASSAPRVFRSDPQAMVSERDRALAKDPALEAPLKRLLKDADKLLDAPPLAVTQKKQPSPTGDPHDYISLAPYFWPNPNTPDGLPYVRHDGRHNPETKEYDAPNFGAMSGRCYTLALAYYLSGNEAYAERATLSLRAWFLDPATRMYPNFDHAQLIKGVNSGRGTGVLEADRLLDVVDAIGLLQGSKSWTVELNDGMQAWFKEFVQWMYQSKGGQDESAAKNNHGTWFDVQFVTYLFFVGDESTAKHALEEAKTKRIASQIQPDGTLPLELARTNSLGYSVFDLTAFTHLADLGRQVGVDLWTYQTSDGRSIRAAADYLLPYLTGEKKWDRSQISKFNESSAIDAFRRISARFEDPKYTQLIVKLREATSSFEYDEIRTPLQARHP